MSTIDKIIGAAVREEERKKEAMQREIRDLELQLKSMKEDKLRDVEKYKDEETDKINSRWKDLTAKEEELKRREDTVSLREEELANIEASWAVLRNAQESFKIERENLNATKTSYLEKDKECELLIEQYNKKLSELQNA